MRHFTLLSIVSTLFVFTVACASDTTSSTTAPTPVTTTETFSGTVGQLATTGNPFAVSTDGPVTIEVRRLSRVVFRAARTGTNAHNDMYVAGKARIVERFGHSTMYERLSHLAQGTTFEDATSLAFPEYAPHGGGFPLAVGGTGVVGVAIVSGLPQEDDHALIVEVLSAYVADAGAG